jgi:ABC-2 type transport system permease protein
MRASMVKAVALRHWRAQARQPGYWYILILLPILDAIMFASIGVAYGDDNRPVELLIMGIMLFHLVWQLTLNASLGFLEEVWSSNLLNLMTTPLTEREFIGGLTLISLCRTSVGIALIAVTGVVGYSVSPSAAGVVLIPSAAILLLFGWAVSLGVIALVLRYGESAEIFSWGFIFLLIPLSGVFYPTDALPDVLQPISRIIPITHVFDAVRTSIDGGGIAWADLGVALAGSILAAAFAIWFLQRMMRTFRSKGLVTNFS